MAQALYSQAGMTEFGRRSPRGSEHIHTNECRFCRDPLARKLALAKVRELRQSGMSFREIGLLFRGTPLRVDGRRPSQPEPVRQPPAQPESALGATLDHHIFVRALDTLGLGLAFFDRNGRLVHGNQALLQILSHGPDGGCLQEEMRREVSLVLSKARVPHHGAVLEVSAREVREGDRCYRLKASYVGVHLFEPGSTVLISIEVLKASPISEEVLQLRYRLTPQEAKVAMMLLRGTSNRLIARALYISEHTARHHTQRVLEKLGLRSRAGIAARLLNGE